MDEIVKWTSAALDDLEQIAEYIGRDSQFYAAALVQEVFSISESTGRMPLAGSIVPEFNDVSIREVLVRRYRLIYRFMAIL
jgi:plasmid stabilization system protein ParE